MSRDASIKIKLLTIILGTVISITILSLVQTIKTINNLSEQNIKKYEIKEYKTKEEELSNYLSVALSTIDAFYQRSSPHTVKEEVKDELEKHSSQLFNLINNEYYKYKNKLTNKELKKRLKYLIANSKYGKSGYFWINDMKPKMIMHPIQPALNGNNLSNYKDPNGVYLFNDMVKVCKLKGDGFVEYSWIKPGYKKPQAKISYVKLFTPYNWIIGTGSYIDDISNELQKEALVSISKMRYGKNGYFWINDTQPKMIMHPIQTDLNGKDLSNYKDSNGVYLFNEMVKKSNSLSKGGLVKYSWPKPDKKEPQPKFSYVKKFEPWNWIVGTGAYVDDIQDRINIMKQETKDKIDSIIFTFILGNILIMILIIIVMNYIVNNNIIKPLKDFQDSFISFFEYLKKERTQVDLLEVKSNDEIGHMSRILNKNIKYTKKILDNESKLKKNLQDLNNNLEEKIKDAVKQNIEQERYIIESARMAQMGEMIGNIAHQWRQPLSVISTLSTGIITQHEYGILDNNLLINDMHKINESSQYLSETINTFRNFLKEEKIMKEQVLQDNILNALNIVSTVLNDYKIKLIEDIDYENKIIVNIVSGELPQVIINIINNAKDIILENKIENGYIKISLKNYYNKISISIEDNGGGVPEEILPKIFDPYFTTKHQSTGTGLGLHMSKRIIKESFHGNLYVKNSKNGAVFYIDIPLTCNIK